MIVKIQVRDTTGAFKYRAADVGEFAETTINRMIEDGRSGGYREGYADGWWWLKQWLCFVLIRRAEKCAISSPSEADLWFKRYQAIRDIQ